VERHRLKAQNRFTRFVHRSNLLFEPPRGADGTKLTCGIYHHVDSVIIPRCDPAYAGDKCLSLGGAADTDGGRLASDTGIADVYVGITGSKIEAREATQGDIAIASGVATEGKSTHRNIVTAAGIAGQRTKTVGSVVVAVDVVIERSSTSGCIVLTGGVLNERFITSGRVGSAGSVAKEGEGSIGRVEAAFGVA
jgi:hypothetical protein